MNRRRISMRKLGLPVVVLLVLGLAGPSWGDPPPWAPAWGYHKDRGKHHKDKDRNAYREQAEYRSPYVASGQCNREGIGHAIGAVVGGAAGSTIGKGDGRTVATIVGTLVGYVLGGSIGRSMDEADRACIGQALEYEPAGREVTWTNPDTDARYTITPAEPYSDDGRYCREFTRQAEVGGRTETVRGTACRQADGTWKVRT